VVGGGSSIIHAGCGERDDESFLQMNYGTQCSGK
jgi:hypothetical protein